MQLRPHPGETRFRGHSGGVLASSERVRPSLALLAFALLLAGCGSLTHMDTDHVDRPDIAVGAGATVIMPGQAAPVVTNQGAQAPGAGGSGSEITMLGGTTGEAVGEVKERQVPIIGPITTLFGYPFWIFGAKLEEKARREAEKQRQGGTAEQPAQTPDERERERLRLENERLQRELTEQRRGAHGAPEPATSTAPVASAPPSTAASAARPAARNASIAAELAALERSLAGGRPDPAAAPVTPAPTAGGSKRALDQSGDGKLDRLDSYDADQKLVRSEEDLDGDGRMETISVYEDGVLARRRADHDGDGQPDAWSFYRGGDLERHEVDRDHDGFRDVSLHYQAGQLAREEEDKNGDGRPDVIARYAAGELAERSEDLDFDGQPDIVSFYEKGKLLRREVRSEELLERAGGPPQS